jgi:hypothetical protein
MMTKDHLDEALRSLAAHVEHTGRLADVDTIRHRGDVRRKRRNVGTATLGVVLVGVVAAGLALARPNNNSQPNLPAAPATSAGPTVSSPDASPSSTVDTPPSAATSVPSSVGPTDPILSGKRQVTIVRVQAFESGVTLADDGRVTEADDDSGRQLFVLTPLGSGSYLIRTAKPGSDGKPSCWQEKANGSNSLTVVGAACSASDPAQKFTISPRGQSNGLPAYSIANRDAYLQYSGRSGLILEELGDAPLTTTFRLVDNGAAPPA